MTAHAHLATIWILQNKHPDLMLLHLAETDSEQHEEGPYTPHAKAVLERSDELIGDILKVLPKDYDLALVSDHGFESVDRMANLKALAAADGVTGAMTIAGGLVTSSDPAVIAWLRGQVGKGDVGREIPAGELAKFSATLSGTGFEPAPHVQFGNGAAPHGAPQGKRQSRLLAHARRLSQYLRAVGRGAKTGQPGHHRNDLAGRALRTGAGRQLPALTWPARSR